MTLELTLGRTTFTVRREPVKRASRVDSKSQDQNTFAQTWMQTFNATWEAKAGACFPKQFSAQHRAIKTEETDG